MKFPSHILFEAKENNPTTTQESSCPIKVAEPLRKAFSLKKPDGSEGVPKFPRSLVIQCYLDCEAENDRVGQMINVYLYSGSLNQMFFWRCYFIDGWCLLFVGYTQAICNLR